MMILVTLQFVILCAGYFCEEYRVPRAGDLE